MGRACRAQRAQSGALDTGKGRRAKAPLENHRLIRHIRAAHAGERHALGYYIARAALVQACDVRSRAEGIRAGQRVSRSR